MERESGEIARTIVTACNKHIRELFARVHRCLSGRERKKTRKCAEMSGGDGDRIEFGAWICCGGRNAKVVFC